ncbi:hypothetical protein B566_EDAN001264 [Ephemera danica]|nr:hypothetical protein B566_EDAN001264 [Ephemera danica]
MINMSSEEKGDIIYEVCEMHEEEKTDDGEELDELENIRREVEMIKEGVSDNPRKIQIPLTRIVRNDEIGEVLHVEEGEQLLHIDSATMEAAQGLVEEIIQQEEEEEEMEGEYEELDSSAEAALQLHSSGTRQKLNYRVVSDDTYQDVQENGRTKIDKDDPRSRTKEFRHQYTLMRHLPTHTDERNFKCETCGKAFRQMSTLSQHRAIHSDARPYICEFCKKTFNRVSTLISHRKTHSEHKPHTCDLCGKGFHQKGNLRNHIFTHTNERPYKCEVCGKGFNQMSNLMCHKVKAHSHPDTSRYICQLCDTEFPKRVSLKSHQEFKHGIKFRIGRGNQVDQQMLQTLLARKKKKDGKNLRIVHLPNGDRTLADVRNISAVMQAHSKARVSQPILETDSHQSTAGVIIDPIQTKAMMKARAQGQTPFALLKPAKGIPVLVKVMPAPNNKQMSTLSQHRAIHSDARPYICEFCKKTFNRVSTLISHRKTHSEHKPHTCDLCGKGFHQKGNLRNHIFTHTNERPYKCEVCGKGFNQMSNLMCHKVKAHSHPDTSRYICQLCDTEFPKRVSLKSHQEFKHGIKFRIGRGNQVDQQMLQTLLARKKKKDGKNLRIVHLPNGDRTLADVRNISAVMQAHSKARVSQPILETDSHQSTAGVIIDPIQTKAMMKARAQGQTPFALLKPAKGIPVLVKVMPAPNNKQMLVPATAEDLKSAGKVTVSPSVNSTEGEPMKAVQIKVPVVATVIQKVLDDGQLVIEVEPPSSEQQQKQQQPEPQAEPSEEVQEDEEEEVEGEEETLNEQMEEDETEECMEEESASRRITYVREDGTIIPEEELADLNPVNLLAAAVNLAQQQPDNQASQSLLELASNGIQFVRPGEDGTYEILSQEEATQMMSEGGQAIEIVGDEQSVAEVVGEEGEEESHTNLSALVEAIRSAGYDVAEGQKQIVISGSDGEQVLLDENQQIMFGESGEIIVVGEDGQQVQYVLQEEEEEEAESTEKE